MAGQALGIDPRKSTELIWPHFRTFNALLRASPRRTMAAMAVVWSRLLGRDCTEVILMAAWNPADEADMDRLSAVLERPRGTVKSTLLNCIEKTARLWLADPVATAIDLAEASIDPMTESEWNFRYRMQTGRMNRNELHPLLREGSFCPRAVPGEHEAIEPGTAALCRAATAHTTKS